MGLEVAIVNIVNLIIAVALLFLTLNAYFSFRLKIFKNAWLVLTLGSLVWVVGHILMILDIGGPIHYILFTGFIIILGIGILMLTRAAKMIGGV